MEKYKTWLPRIMELVGLEYTGWFVYHYFLFKVCLYATKCVKGLQTANGDQKREVEIIENALKAPTFAIASNAGADGALVVGKLLEQDDLNLGYDAAKGAYQHMVKAGIIDPVKVVRTALVDAASVSLLFTTTEAAIVDRQEEINPLANRMPNMGDMH
ncbi:chaperonin CPN60-like 2, mitochondrial [Lycium ferocissimum]|uniref:chaperonin CPN60-like 2, mitochondrial n=1 Tax=Lycium ferocissimum TaxID=112874 RepID=UPI002816575A|nr:chaperonin CPN60-like 2, mitochondrial [Lycium ferocissimum]